MGLSMPAVAFRAPQRTGETAGFPGPEHGGMCLCSRPCPVIAACVCTRLCVFVHPCVAVSTCVYICSHADLGVYGLSVFLPQCLRIRICNFCVCSCVCVCLWECACLANCERAPGGSRQSRREAEVTVEGGVQRLPGKAGMCWAGTRHSPVTARDVVRKQICVVSNRGLQKEPLGLFSGRVAAQTSGQKAASWA